MPNRHILWEISVSLDSHTSACNLPVRLTRSIDGWNYESHPMKKNEYGVFEIVVPAKGKEKAIPHNSKVKVL